jgi:hypothetical protein
LLILIKSFTVTLLNPHLQLFPFPGLGFEVKEACETVVVVVVPVGKSRIEGESMRVP